MLRFSASEVRPSPVALCAFPAGDPPITILDICPRFSSIGSRSIVTGVLSTCNKALHDPQQALLLALLHDR
ncbi:hypothetical protein A4X13_0g456 [Tilletia indica]|uniref:Uncharacterized protein n=1 Tax=Tilletia indica TaxID=43049 RepID=A0A177SXW5_9BASI|nr:hypothetical protein A4X13_0g456 [Tilletia indica]